MKRTRARTRPVPIPHNLHVQTQIAKDRRAGVPRQETCALLRISERTYYNVVREIELVRLAHQPPAPAAAE